MSAILKKLEEKREKRGGFIVPTVEEIKDHMKTKMNWPDDFCHWYAEKFWNNYEASGWKLSNGNAMKSWTATFAAQWQDLKYDESRNKLKEIIKTTPAIVRTMTNGTDKLNDLLSRFKTKFESVSNESLIRAYDYMKEHKLIKLSTEEKNYIKAAYGDNVEKGKAACVKTLFTNMINHGKRF